jgi:hypothetical protein
MLDLFTMASPALPNARPRPSLRTTSRAIQQVPSILDYFSDAALPTDQESQQAKPKPSMLDAFTDPQRSLPQRYSTPQPPPAASMLDAFMDFAPAAKNKPQQPSMLDAFMDPKPTAGKVSQPPSMLDAFTEPRTVAAKSPTKASQPPSMLDAFMDTTPTPNPKEPASMLAAFTEPQAATSGKASVVAVSQATATTSTQSEVDGATMKTEDKSKLVEQHEVPGFGQKMQRKKVEKEPDANSILDNFKF